MRHAPSFSAQKLLKNLSGSIATASSALMSHNLHKMGLKPGFSVVQKARFTTDSQAPSTRAERMKLVPSVIPPPLNDEEWKKAELRWIVREERHCPICLQRFGSSEMLCSSCSHAVHKDCFVNWISQSETRWCCPVCMTPANMRESPFLKSYMCTSAARDIQAAIRGYFGRRCCRALRKRSTGVLVTELERAANNMNSYLLDQRVKLDSELGRLQKELDETNNLFEAFMATRTISWISVIEKTRQRQSKACPICFENFDYKGVFISLASDSEKDACTVSTVSCCSALFHSDCLDVYESVADRAVCPCCKSGFISHKVEGIS